MTEVTRERVEAAYAALGSGDRARILEYYSEDLRCARPGAALRGDREPALVVGQAVAADDRVEGAL
ncbi:hypothetical protein ACWDA9_41760, partial [Streptomyces sp. NPDC001193]